MKRIAVLWLLLGAAYVSLEVMFRGRSHPAMLVVGGLCGVLVGAINQFRCFYKRPVVLQAVLGTVIVLVVEFISGCILNLWLGLGIWDYSNQPFNILGQVCPLFGLIWFSIMPLAIWAEDTLRWVVWAYSGKLYGAGGKEPNLYSLRSIYCDFIHGR